MPTAIKQAHIDIDRQKVLQAIGYSAVSEPSTRILSLVDEYTDNAVDFIAPLYSYVIMDINSVEQSLVVIDGSVVFESQVIARLLENCEKVAVFALTIGEHLEEMTCHLADDGLVLQATVLDAIGSVAVERLANSVHDKISEEARSYGLCTSRRFSPGYCDWDVSQQKMVFQALNGHSAGIRLTEDCLMLPRKSVSGIIGLGTSRSDVRDYNSCTTCGKQDCPGRR